MRRVWAVGVVAVLALAVGCGGSSGGTGGDGGNPPNDGGTLPDGGITDGGCTGLSCGTDGGIDGGTDGGVTTAPLQAAPDRIVIGTTPGGTGSAQLTLQNTGASAVTLQSLNVSGAQASAFQVSGASLPADIGPGASIQLTIGFSSGSEGVSKATLSAVTPGGTTTVPLGGLALAAGKEPSLQWIFDVHNIPVTAGNPDPAKRDFPPLPIIAGDEIAIPSFVKAGDGPVTVQLLASYGPTYEPVSVNGWYASGSGSSRNELFRIAQANAFALDPPIENGGTLSFDPGSTAFGFWNEWPFWEIQQKMGNYLVYQEDSLNTWDTGNNGTQHHVRVYPYKNPDGSFLPNAYIVTTEEAPISAGPDYNDVVYVVRNVMPPGSGGGGALQLQNLDGEPWQDRMFFNRIDLPIRSCWGSVTVKDTGMLRVRNTSSSPVNVSSVSVTDDYTATPSIPLPTALAPGASFDVTVTFTATTGRVHIGTLTVASDDAQAPSRTITLAGFRQVEPQSPNEPTLEEVVNQLYGFRTVVGTEQQLNTGGRREAVGDEVLSSYWVKADTGKPVTVHFMSAWHSGYDCGDASAKSYGSSGHWFAKGRAGSGDDRFLTDGHVEDIQRLLPRRYDPSQATVRTFDPGAQSFGFHIEDEFSDESMAEQEPWCTASDVCGHRIRFWPVKDQTGNPVPNSWIMSIDMHRRGIPNPSDFFSNYDFNDETYLLENMMPEPQ